MRVIKQNRGVFDAMPLSLITTQAVAGVGAGGLELDPQRFRPNLLVEATGGGGPVPENAWVGRVLRIGGLAMRVDQRDQRCVVVNVDPATRRAGSGGAEGDRAHTDDLPGRLRLDRASRGASRWAIPSTLDD